MAISIRSKAQNAVPDVDTLRSELDSLRSQIEKLVGGAAATGGAQVRRLSSKASDRVGGLVSDGEAILGDVTREVGRELRIVEKHAGNTVRERPVQSLAVALGIGFALAFLLRR